MATLYKTISDEFIRQLSEKPEFDHEQLERLKQLLAEKKKPKVADLVELFSTPLGGEVK